MSKYNFNVGDQVKDSCGMCGTFGYVDSEPVCWVDGCPNPYYMSASDWELDPTAVLPKRTHESDWSYAEAERLQKLAHEAIDAYNEYINAKPNTVFLTIFK